MFKLQQRCIVIPFLYVYCYSLLSLNTTQGLYTLESVFLSIKKQLLKNVYLVRPRFFVIYIIYTIRSRHCAREKSVVTGLTTAAGLGVRVGIGGGGYCTRGLFFFFRNRVCSGSARCLYIQVYNVYIYYIEGRGFAANNNVRRRENKKKKKNKEKEKKTEKNKIPTRARRAGNPREDGRADGGKGVYTYKPAAV